MLRGPANMWSNNCKADSNEVKPVERMTMLWSSDSVCLFVHLITHVLTLNMLCNLEKPNKSCIYSRQTHAESGESE